MAAVLDPLARFGALDAAARGALERACAGVAHVAPHADLVRQGEPPHALHVLVDGWACRHRLLEDGRRQVPALLLPGDPCDLDGLGDGLGDGPGDGVGGVRLAYGVAAVTACRVAAWPHPALAAAMRDHPAIGAALLRAALADNARLTQGAVVLGRLAGRERLAHLLCELLARLEAVGRAGPDGCDLPVTQALLADVLGLSTVHVNRVVQELRGEGLIRLEGGRLTVPDPEALRAAGLFEPDYLRRATAGRAGLLDAGHRPGREGRAGLG